MVIRLGNASPGLLHKIKFLGLEELTGGDRGERVPKDATRRKGA